MDAAVAKAGVVMAAGLLLLVPTFNALNQSYVQNVPPPPWMPTPPTPPDITPPTDMTPPTDFKPPPDYKGPIPPGACPPPVIKYVGNFTDPMGTSPGFTASHTMSVPKSTAVMQGYVNFTGWQATTIRVTLADPDGTTVWSQSEAGSGQLMQPTPKPKSSFFYNSTDSSNARPPAAGNWTLSLSADFPIQGNVKSTFAVAIPCGGLASP